MDPVTMTISITTLVGKTLEVLHKCNEFYQKYQAANLQLVCMQTQCSIIEVSLQQVQDLILHDSFRFQRLQSVSMLAKNYDRTLGTCQIVFAILNDRLNKLFSDLQDNRAEMKWSAKLKAIWNERESAILLRNIEGQASAINLLLNAIQMKTQAEMLGLLTRKESKIMLKNALDDASSLRSADENYAKIELSNNGSILDSELGDVDFDFDEEVINTAAYRQVFNKARKISSPDESSQLHHSPHLHVQNCPPASPMVDLHRVETPLASRRDTPSSSGPSALPQDIRPDNMQPRGSGETIHDGSNEPQYQKHLAEPEDRSELSVTTGKTRFGSYVLHQTIAEGHRSEVKLARKRSDAPIVVMKLRQKLAELNPNPVSQAFRECIILKTLEHPNIIRFHEVLETDKFLGSVFDYVPGGTLAEYVTSQRYLKDLVAQRLFAQIVGAVSYLHRKGIVHLALSSRKFVMNYSKNLILTGFSHAETFNCQDKQSDDEMEEMYGQKLAGLRILHQSEETIYSAPEPVIRDFKGGSKADAWSCGVILYFMLAGLEATNEEPADHNGINYSGRLYYIHIIQDVFPEYVTYHSRDLVKRLIVRDPAKRQALPTIAFHSWLCDHLSDIKASARLA